MTHEQKSERPAFRSREEIEMEMDRLLTHGARGPNAAMQVVHRIFDEVRALGASEERSASRAEQGRKDAAISPAVTEELATALNELSQARAVIVELQGAPRSRQDAEAFESLERYGGAVRAALRAWQHIREVSTP